MDPLSTLTPRILQGRVIREEEVPERRRLLGWSSPPNTVPCFFCSSPSQILLVPPGAKQPPFRQKLDGGELSGGQSLLSQVLLFHSNSDRSRAERAAKWIQFYFMHTLDFSVHPYIPKLPAPSWWVTDLLTPTLSFQLSLHTAARGTTLFVKFHSIYLYLKKHTVQN